MIRSNLDVRDNVEDVVRLVPEPDPDVRDNVEDIFGSNFYV
jgi:hypothetical protein